MEQKQIVLNMAHDFETVMPDEFVTIMPRKKSRKMLLRKMTPSILYNNVDGYVVLNSACVKTLGTPYALFRKSKSNKDLVEIMGCSEKRPGTHTLSTSKTKSNGRTWGSVEIVEVFENCLAVTTANKNEHERFRFYGMYQADRNSIVFNLSDAELAGKTKRRNQKKRNSPEAVMP